MHPSGQQSYQDAAEAELTSSGAGRRGGLEDDRCREARSVLEEVAALLQSGGSPDRFLGDLLAVQCRLAGAEGGVLLQTGSQNRVKLLAAHPQPSPEGNAPEWMNRAADSAHHVIADGRTHIHSEPAIHDSKDQPQRHIIVVPILEEDTVRAAAAFVARAQNPQDLMVCRRQLEITSILLNFCETELTLQHRHADLDRIYAALEVLAAFNQSRYFMSSAMALCNEIAVRQRCHKVSLGFLNGRYVRVLAMSHTEKFSRNTRLVQDIEATMEECLDQDIEVIYPANGAATFVSRAAAQLSKIHGPSAILSLPIRQEGRVFAVMTLEQSPENPFGLDEIEAVRLICDLCAPRLMELREYDRWFGARMAASMRNFIGVAIGPKHTWVKLWAILIFLGAVFLTFAKGDYRVAAPFAFEASVQQAVVAPFETSIKSVAVGPGDRVEAGKTVLGKLETSELRLKLVSLKAEQFGYQKQMAASMRDHKTADAQIAQAQNDKIAAEIELLERKIEQGTLVAPISGLIISEDLKQQIGAPVEIGAILFEIALIESLRAELYVPEDLIPDVKAGQNGELVSVGHPHQKVPLVIEQIHPMAEMVNQKNVFKVRARLLERHQWMRPGMEGLAKISAGQERYIWIAFRRFINWMRMKLWY